MSLANPIALLWALLVIPVVIFYILKIRLKRVPVSTVIFWRQIFDEKKPRSLWQRLRHLVSLFLQIGLLLLLVAALAEPFFSWEANTSRRVVLVIDNSASMNAAEGNVSRLSKAKTQALEVIRGLRHRDEMAVIVAGTQPAVVCGLTGHQKTLRHAVEEISPTDGPTKLTAAIALARRLATDTEGYGIACKIVVVSDGCAEDTVGPVSLPAPAVETAGADKNVQPANGPDIQYVIVGNKLANVAITRFQVRRSTYNPIGYEILAEVTNLSDEPSGDFRLAIELNGNPVEVEPITHLDERRVTKPGLAPNERWSKVFDKTTEEGGLLTASLVVKGEKGDEPLRDGLVADNKAVAVLPKREPTPIHMHSPIGNLFLLKVLEANPLAQVTTSKEMPKEYPAGSVKVFHREVPAKLPPGPVLVVDPTNDCDLWKIGDKLTNPIVTQQDKESPLMAHVRLDNVVLPEARKLIFTAAAGKPQVLAGAVTGDPLFVLIERPEGKVAVLSVNLDQGDLPFRTAFPILAMNTIGVFTSGPGDLREALATGSTADVTLSTSAAGIGGYVLRSPDGATKKLPVGGIKSTIGPFDKCGIWSVQTDTAEPQVVEEFAVNLMNKAESDLRQPEGAPGSSSASDAGLVSGFLGRPVWWYLCGLAALLFVVEWYLYQRRWIS